MPEFDRLPAATIRRIQDRSKSLGLDSVGAAWAIETEAERAIVAQLAALLPGTYYMDPPDGGSVTVMEQLRRMAKDAERYRWLRSSGHAELYVWAPGIDPCKGVVDEGLDAGIDAALQAEREARAATQEAP